MKKIETGGFRKPFHVQVGTKRPMESLEQAADAISHLLVMGLITSEEGEKIRSALADRVLDVAQYGRH